MNALVPIQPSNADVYRASTDAAGLCREIVLATAKVIDKRKYVQVEGWEAIALAHGCVCSSGKVEEIESGIRAVGFVRRMSDGATIAEAEGFVGRDEPTWYGGETVVNEWINGQPTGNKIKKVLPKRADYAIRAMAQTRAISRAARSAFAHVVVMMNAGLSTTPAEEVPDEGFGDKPRDAVSQEETSPRGKGSDKTKGAKAKDEAPVLSAGAIAAINAIKAIATEQALGDWGVANGPMIKGMDAPDALAVRQAYGCALEAFRRAAEEAAVSGKAAGDDPFSDPAAGQDQDAKFEDKADDPPPEWTREQSLQWRDGALKQISVCNTEAELRTWNAGQEANIVAAMQTDYEAVEQAWKARAAAIRDQEAGLKGRS